LQDVVSIEQARQAVRSGDQDIQDIEHIRADVCGLRHMRLEVSFRGD
jgi:hypothetical protein